MAEEQRSYSLEELAERSGIEPETIRRWGNQHLIPAPGRGDDQSRYPRETLDRLCFVARVMKFVDEGDMAPVSPADLAAALDRLDPLDIITANQATLSAERLAAMLMLPTEQPAEDSNASSQRRRSLKPGAKRRSRPTEVPGGDDGEPARELDRLRRLLREVSARARQPNQADQPAFSPVPISDELVLFIKGLAEEDRDLAEELALQLRALLEDP